MYDLWIIVIFFAVLYFWYKLHGHINKIVNMVTFSDQSRRLCNLALVLFYILFINSNLCIMTYLWGAPATKFALALKMRWSFERFGSPRILDFTEYFCRSKFALLMLKCSYFCQLFSTVAWTLAFYLVLITLAYDSTYWQKHNKRQKIVY